jgi:hypothetical protein
LLKNKSEPIEEQVKTTAWIFDQYDKCHYDKVHGGQKWILATIVSRIFCGNSPEKCPVCDKKVNTSCNSMDDTTEISRFPKGGYEGGDRLVAFHTPCYERLRSCLNAETNHESQ